MFDADQFIDGWSESLDWRAELKNKTMTVTEILAQLRNLETDYERQGLRDEEAEPVDWAEVEEALEEYASND